MSTLSVYNLQGISTYSNTVRIPTGHTLDINQNLKIPTWTNSTRPTSTVNGLLGFNTETYTLELYFGAWFTLAQSGLGRSAGSAAVSASAIKTADPTATDGIYWIKPTGYTGAAFQVYCDMTTNGGGWMHVGTISDNNESINNANHIWGLPLNPSQDTGIWQDSNTYGSLSLNSNYKSLAWIHCPFTQFLCKDLGVGQRNLFFTNAGQIPSSNSSFSTFWGSLSWGADGSENSNTSYNGGRTKGVTITNFSVVDPVLESGNKNIILLKFGERDGVQDGNKDRTMIAWHRHDQGDNVDSPNGLGCFTNRSGTLDRRNIVPTANRADFPPGSITGAPFHYTLWVR